MMLEHGIELCTSWLHSERSMQVHAPFLTHVTGTADR